MPNPFVEPDVWQTEFFSIKIQSMSGSAFFLSFENFLLYSVFNLAD